jgi:hypothetical protein
MEALEYHIALIHMAGFPRRVCQERRRGELVCIISNSTGTILEQHHYINQSRRQARRTTGQGNRIS